MVDDDPLNLKVLAETLGQVDCRLLAARSGEDALRIAREAQPLLILLDIQMPGIDGYETCRRLKAEARTQEIAVIFLTALQGTADKVKGLSLGAVDFITKPFDPDEVLARVRRQIDVQRRHAQLRMENRSLADKLSSALAKGTAPDTATATGLKTLIREGEGEQAEFKSTLRLNLKTDRFEKVIEKAWLKTLTAFMNSNGGVLLVGVNDDGRVAGLGADRFENDDKLLLHVNNLLRQHIGLSFAACIRYHLVSVDDCKVLVFRCRASSQPAFLKMGKDEEFYVRVGSGSRRLSPSEVIDYVTHRRADSLSSPTF